MVTFATKETAVQERELSLAQRLDQHVGRVVVLTMPMVSDATVAIGTRAAAGVVSGEAQGVWAEEHER